ncbi:hypothetical protein CB1_001652034 [Camelus ferus]|nr:hypothetical protein CB1_001652034 [Camelus ferus]
MLLNELLCISKVPPGTKHVDMDLDTLPPTTAMAILLYNRWAIRTIVQSSFPVKQAKPGPPQLSVRNRAEIGEQKACMKLKEQASDSILVLEAALKLNKDLYVHTMRTLDFLAMEPGMVNGETESSTAGLKIKTEEMQCQIGSLSLHCTIDEKRLAGYCQACDVLVPSSDSTSQQLTPYSQVHICLRSGNYQEVIKIFVEDNLTFSLPVQFRQSVLRELFQKAQQGNEALDEICFKVCACNTVRDILEASASVNIGQLEHQLILSVDPWRIRQILIELHGMTSERQFWTVSNKDFSHAKQLFAACLELVTEFSPKLRQVMLNEMLLLDIHTHEAGTGQSGERPPSDLISRVRGYLEMRLPDIPLRQVIAEECVAFMLNWRENEYLTLQVPALLLQSNPYVKEPLVLTIILSLFVKLHNVREDIVNDITAEHISIWPSSIPK